jgi:hypothetical protein
MKAQTRLLVAALLFASVAVCWPQAGSSFFDREGVVVAVYTTVHGTMQLDASVSVAASDRRQYDIVAAYVWNALPPGVKSCVSRLELFISTSDSRADKVLDGAATQNGDGVTWTLALDAEEGEAAITSGDPEHCATFDKTIAHEVGHVISFNTAPPTGMEKYGFFFDEESYWAKGVYLSEFYNIFWRGHYPHGNSREAWGDASFRYKDEPTAYVTEYAASDPSEDFAESFAYFVLGPSPYGGTLKEGKMRFFSFFPNLLKDRTLMRAGLASSKDAPD